jgi:LuxR family maltose regulon positive regulatory protein
MPRRALSTLPPPPGDDVIEAKLAPPSLHPDHVSRPRLLHRLDDAVSRALTLIGAPAGFGKSSLVAEWCDRLAPPKRFAWLTLDADDNDPVVFWRYVVYALRRLEPTSFGPALALLNRRDVGLTGAILPALLNELWTLPDEIVLVLDDYHEVTNFDCHESLDFFLRHLPPTLHVVIATRADPPLSLGSMRARGDLTELRAPDLRFTEAEVAEWLNERLGLALTNDVLGSLTQRTEGWPAGLYLAALSLRDRSDVDLLIATFNGGNHHLVEYLAGEVLERIPCDEREFLLQTSILETLTAPLCEALTGRTGASEMLAALERKNQFLIQLDDRRETYRYHQLFRELLLLELQWSTPDLVPELHRRAAAWYHDAGDGVRAMRHALAAKDYALVESVLAGHVCMWMNDGYLGTVAGWLNQIPESEVAERPILAVLGAWVSGLMLGPPQVVEHYASMARAHHDPGPFLFGEPSLEVATAIARASFPVDDVGSALTLAETSIEAMRASDGVASFVASAALGLNLYLDGRPADAEDALRRALCCACAEQWPIVAGQATAWLALTRLAQGDSAEAEHLARQALELVAVSGLHDTPNVWPASAALGMVLTREGRLAEAESVLAEGVEPHLDRLRAWPLFYALALLALVPVRQGRGHATAARALVEEARAALRGCPGPGMLPARLAEVERGLGRAPRRVSDLRQELSDGELRVLRLLASDLSQREIGRELYLSVNTVKSHSRAIYTKLDAASRPEAVARARALCLIA